MAQAAYDQGLDSIGFTCHSYLEGDDGCITPHTIEAYKAEARELEEKYRPLGLEIFLGIEQDVCSPPIEDASDYDFIIGSVHNIMSKGERVMIDIKSCFYQNLETHFSGDPIALAEKYFKSLETVYETTGCHIVGHFDLITKFNEGGRLFDESDRRYEAAAMSALEKLIKKDLIFEINTGAMSRGYRSEPYPSKRWLSIIHDMGGKVTYTSDCHDAEYLAHGFEAAIKLAKDCGFDSFLKLKRINGICQFVPEKI